MKKNELVWEEVERIGKEKQREERRERIRKSGYAREIKEILLKDTGREYMEEERIERKNELNIRARFRMGNESNSRKHWRKEEENRCRLCGKKEETYAHIFEKCGKTRSYRNTWVEILEGGVGSLAKMKKVIWKRNHAERGIIEEA